MRRADFSRFRAAIAHAILEQPTVFVEKPIEDLVTLAAPGRTIHLFDKASGERAAA